MSPAGVTVAGLSARANIPIQQDPHLIGVPPSGRINPGDWVAFSGQYVIATNQGNKTWWRHSGLGVAIEGSPGFDRYGNVVTAESILVRKGGRFLVSAAFSGRPALGIPIYPVATGSAVGFPTGISGMASTWQTASLQPGSGAVNRAPSGVAMVVGARNFSNAGTGEIEIDISPLPPDMR